MRPQYSTRGSEPSEATGDTSRRSYNPVSTGTVEKEVEKKHESRHSRLTQYRRPGRNANTRLLTRRQAERVKLL